MNYQKFNQVYTSLNGIYHSCQVIILPLDELTNYEIGFYHKFSLREIMIVRNNLEQENINYTYSENKDSLEYVLLISIT